MKIAGENTVNAIMSNVKGDMSNLTNVVVPTMAELYENIETLDEEKEGVFITITKDKYNALSDSDRKANNYIIVDEDSSGLEGFEDAINNIFSE